MKDVIRFFSEVKLELGKVVWPDFNELVGSVIIVLLLVCAFSVYLGAIDLFFYRIAERIF
ncbi:MAG: preprotein translocase subunit SecE [Candidatus Babeliales bacterium]